MLSIVDSFLVKDEKSCPFPFSSLQPSHVEHLQKPFVTATNISMSSYVNQSLASRVPCLLSAFHSDQILEKFLLPLLQNSLNPEGRGWKETFHLGLGVPRSFILCTFSNCGVFALSVCSHNWKLP